MCWLRENEKRRRTENVCVRPREKRDILKMSGGEQMGRWGHTCGSPKSDPLLFFFFFFYLFIYYYYFFFLCIGLGYYTHDLYYRFVVA